MFMGWAAIEVLRLFCSSARIPALNYQRFLRKNYFLYLDIQYLLILD